MDGLDEIAERIRLDFEARTAARDRALAQVRTLTRHCSLAIRAIHRMDLPGADAELAAARKLAANLRSDLTGYPDLYNSGYTQDALKEFAEAEIVVALLTNQPLPTPEQIEVDYATYLKGLAEANGELRRRCLDILRDGYSEQADQYIEMMDDIYMVLVTMDFPDAITGGLRRLTDIARSINEKTRGDMTINLRQAQLERSLEKLQASLDQANQSPPGEA